MIDGSRERNERQIEVSVQLRAACVLAIKMKRGWPLGAGRASGDDLLGTAARGGVAGVEQDDASTRPAPPLGRRRRGRALGRALSDGSPARR